MNKKIILAKELVEKILNNEVYNLDEKHYCMFSIVKFILIKEQLLPKDINCTLYFDVVNNKKYIPQILAFANYIKEHGEYSMNDTKFELNAPVENRKELEETLWLFNKIRDVFVHGEYQIDFNQKMIIINDDHLNDFISFKIICNIPLSLINQLFYEFEELSNNCQYYYEEPISRYLEKLFSEVYNLLLIDSKQENSFLIIALYNYMALVFSKQYNLSNKYLNMRNLNINFDLLERGAGIEYFKVVKCIENKCRSFNKKISTLISLYNENANNRFRRTLINEFNAFYNSILEKLGMKNELINTSIRNGVEHGLYKYNEYGEIVISDQLSHNDLNTKKFELTSSPQDLFQLVSDIENNKNSFKINDFLEELLNIINPNVVEYLMINLNKLSIIIFGEELNLNYTMEQMYQEEIANVIKEIVKVKTKNGG